MSHEAILPTFIDSTMRSTASSCLEKFNLEFVRGARSAGVSIDLHAGGMFALAIEETYKGIWIHNLSLLQALERAQFLFETAWGDVTPLSAAKKAKCKERVWDCVVGGDFFGKGKQPEDNLGYFQVYPPRTDHVQPYFDTDGKPTFEYTFAIPLEPAIFPYETSYNPDPPFFPLHPNGQPFMYCGRFDMLGSYCGRPCARDEKTTGAITSNWAEQWNMRGQFLGYCWALQAAGIPCDTVVVRGIAMQVTQIGHAEAIKTYSKHEIASWHEQLRRDLWRIRRAWDEGYFDRSYGEACSAYGGCQFTDVCRSPNPENWLFNFSDRRWNPLHKDPTV